MSSPGEHSTMPSSFKQAMNSPPLYPSTDRFLPLGFSTPQHQRGHSSHARNYYSVQPQHMLPRARGLYNRYGQNKYHNRSNVSSHDFGLDNDGQRSASTEPGRQNCSRNWRGHQSRNQRYGGQRHQHNLPQRHLAEAESYNVNDYYHPSMMEDPWEFLLRKSTIHTEGTEITGIKDRLTDDEDAEDSSSSVEKS